MRDSRGKQRSNSAAATDYEGMPQLVQPQLMFDEVGEGDEAPVIRHVLTFADLIVYSGASGDFAPLHHDDLAAKRAGMPGVFAHGMLSAGLLGVAVTNYVGVANLRRYKVRFTEPAWLGEAVHTLVRVCGKRHVNGIDLVDLTCSLINSDGAVKVSGEATAQAFR
jgi:acyl dehydratase